MKTFMTSFTYTALLTLVCGFSAFSTGCADLEYMNENGAVNKVIGGKVSAKYPGVVGLSYNGDIGCTGTLITKRSVLTAAHCLLVTQGDQVYSSEPDEVVFTKKKKVKSRIAVIGTQLHPDYLNNYRNDLAIVYLATDAPEDPVKMFKKPVSQLTDQKSVIVGFGVDDNGSHGVKRETNMKVTSYDDEFVYVESPNRKHRSSCYGDSGGPVLVTIQNKLQIAGILRTGSTEDCSRGDVSYYTRIDDERRWIRNNQNL